MIKEPRHPGFVPDQIGPFRVVAPLGEGKLGRVFLAERTGGFAQRVAIKVLNPLAAAVGGEAPEGAILHSLDHENIVRILDHGATTEGLRYLVLEYVDGQSIDAYCALRRLPVEARVPLLLQVMAAISYAHQRLVVHADLKPSNVLVDRSENGETVRLLDFGVAHTLQRNKGESASSYTPEFAAPEQREGRAVTVGTDIYALGLLSSLLLCGTVERAGSSRAMSERLRQLPAADLDAFAAERSTNGGTLMRMVSGDLDAIVKKALQPEPAARYLTVDAMRDDMLSYLSGRETTVLPANPVRRLGRWVRRNQAVAAASFLVVALLLFSAGGVLWRHSQVIRQQQAARERLLEVIRLTGSLEGDLYRSTAPLEGSERARRSLIDSARKALDEIAAGNRQDPVIALELARQYAHLAKIEGIATTDASTSAQLGDDVTRGLDLLRSVPPDPEEHEIREELDAISAKLSSSN
jgi:serine/threonine-protein kinase